MKCLTESAESVIKECAAEKGDFQLLAGWTYVLARHSIMSLVDESALGDRAGRRVDFGL